MLDYVDCQAQAIGAGGYQALAAPGSTAVAGPDRPAHPVRRLVRLPDAVRPDARACATACWRWSRSASCWRWRPSWTGLSHAGLRCRLQGAGGARRRDRPAGGAAGRGRRAGRRGSTMPTGCFVALTDARHRRPGAPQAGSGGARRSAGRRRPPTPVSGLTARRARARRRPRPLPHRRDRRARRAAADRRRAARARALLRRLPPVRRDARPVRGLGQRARRRPRSARSARRSLLGVELALLEPRLADLLAAAHGRLCDPRRGGRIVRHHPGLRAGAAGDAGRRGAGRLRLPPAAGLARGAGAAGGGAARRGGRGSRYAARGPRPGAASARAPSRSPTRSPPASAARPARRSRAARPAPTPPRPRTARRRPDATRRRRRRCRSARAIRRTRGRVSASAGPQGRQAMNKQTREALDAYYVEAESWAKDRQDALRASRRTAWIVAAAAAIDRGARGARADRADAAEDGRALYPAGRSQHRLRPGADAARSAAHLRRHRAHPELPRPICDRPRELRHRHGSRPTTARSRLWSAEQARADLCRRRAGLEPAKPARALSAQRPSSRRG